jgi:hypothetical protein
MGTIICRETPILFFCYNLSLGYKLLVAAVKAIHYHCLLGPSAIRLGRILEQIGRLEFLQLLMCTA